jgi:hypothetical protein
MPWPLLGSLGAFCRPAVVFYGPPGSGLLRETVLVAPILGELPAARRNTYRLFWRFAGFLARTPNRIDLCFPIAKNRHIQCARHLVDVPADFLLTFSCTFSRDQLGSPLCFLFSTCPNEGIRGTTSETR